MADPSTMPLRDDRVVGFLTRPPGRITLLVALVLVVAGLLAYSNSFGGAWVFDDQVWIVQNPAVRHLGLPGAGRRRMVATYSLALNYAVGGLHVGGYHAVNLALHLLAGLTLWGLLRRTLRGPKLRPRFGAAAEGLALAVALLWLLHPLQTQAVDYIVQRMEVLMALGYLLTLYAVARMAQSPRPWLWGAVAWLACLLGMLSKEVMVSAPLLAIVYDRIFLASSWRAVFRKRGGLYLALAALWGVYPLLGMSELTSSSSTLGFGFEKMTTGAYLLHQPAVLLHYLRLVFWPHPLVFDYGSGIIPGLGPVVPCTVVLVLLLTATGWALWRRPAAGFLGLAFFFILAPTSSVVPLPDLCVEHRMYLPLAAVLTLVVVGGYAGWQRLGWPQTTGAGAAALALLLGLAAVLGAATWQRNHAYHSALTLWQDTVAKRPHSARAHDNFGSALDESGSIHEAAAEHAEALRLQPAYPQALVNLGTDLAHEGKKQEALTRYQEALRLSPDYPQAHYDVANLLATMGQNQQALDHYQHALHVKPRYAEAHNNMGIVLERLGRRTEALAQYQAAVATDTGRPDYFEGHRNLASLLAVLGQKQQAIEHYWYARALAQAVGRQDWVMQIDVQLEACGAGRP
jgi:Flp pilus assembly protein TadD